jgi:hypothetical protein
MSFASPGLSWQRDCLLNSGGTMKSIRFATPALILCAALLLNSSAALAKKEYTVKEKKSCAFCHVTATSKELNDAGKYYKEKKTLEGYVADKAAK